MTELDQDGALDALVAKLTTDLESTGGAPRFGWWRVLLYAFVLILLLVVAYLLSTFVPADNVAAFAGVLSGLAALALAILTALLLVLNQRLIAATYKMAQATSVEALATLAEARASRRQVEVATRTLDAMQLDQEMAWRPYLVVDNLTPSTAFLRNIGRGPALNVLVLDRPADSTPWEIGGPVAVPVNPELAGVVRLPLVPQVNPPPKEVLGHNPSPDIVVLCRDQFGNWFRFEPERAALVSWRFRSEDPKPVWVVWAETYGTGPGGPPPKRDEYGDVVKA